MPRYFIFYLFHGLRKERARLNDCLGFGLVVSPYMRGQVISLTQQEKGLVMLSWRRGWLARWRIFIIFPGVDDHKQPPPPRRMGWDGGKLREGLAPAATASQEPTGRGPSRPVQSRFN